MLGLGSGFVIGEVLRYITKIHDGVSKRVSEYGVYSSADEEGLIIIERNKAHAPNLVGLGVCPHPYVTMSTPPST